MPVLDCRTSHIECGFYKLLQNLDRRTIKELEAEPEYIKKGDSTLVLVFRSKPLSVETFTEYSYWPVRICDMRQTVAVGIIKLVMPRRPLPLLLRRKSLAS